MLLKNFLPVWGEEFQILNNPKKVVNTIDSNKEQLQLCLVSDPKIFFPELLTISVFIYPNSYSHKGQQSEMWCLCFVVARQKLVASYAHTKKDDKQWKYVKVSTVHLGIRTACVSSSLASCVLCLCVLCYWLNIRNSEAPNQVHIKLVVIV